jgi:nucleotide-binding universal stress UspA family protein
MQRYKKLLVALNLEETDESLIRYAARIGRMAGSEEVHFYYISDELDLPRMLCSAVEGDRSCRTVIDRMQGSVEAHFEGGAEMKTIFDASEGDRLADILAYTKEKDIDLVLVEKICGGSKMPERLARKAPCSVLLVTPGTQASFEKIFAALDFSEQSKQSLETALAFARASGMNKVTCVHVYSVPLGYAKTGHSYEKFSEIMEDNARGEYERFMESLDTRGIETEFVLQHDKRPVDGIARIVHDAGANLLVVRPRAKQDHGHPAGSGDRTPDRDLQRSHPDRQEKGTGNVHS